MRGFSNDNHGEVDIEDEEEDIALTALIQDDSLLLNTLTAADFCGDGDDNDDEMLDVGCDDTDFWCPREAVQSSAGALRYLSWKKTMYWHTSNFLTISKKCCP